MCRRATSLCLHTSCRAAGGRILALFVSMLIAVNEALRFDVLTSFVYRVCKTGLASVGVGWTARRAATEFLHSFWYLIFRTENLQRRASI
jgi:hypothetical protein